MLVPEKFRWFPQARLGLFIHFGPYAVFERGEQVLMREAMDQRAYADAACGWNPRQMNATEWAEVARAGGFKYAVFTTRHHDGYCMWNTATTDYCAARQAARRDFVREFVDAFRAAGLRVGLYYSLGDWRIPAMFEGPDRDPHGWDDFVRYCHAQVRELLTNYGVIDQLWFDGAWPRTSEDWRARELIAMIRSLQPDILINNRLGASTQKVSADGGTGAGESADLGDFGTPEHQIVAENRLWESCQVSTWRLWGWARHERFRPTDVLLDMLCECAQKGGNLLLNVGPDPDGVLPPAFVSRSAEIGRWLELHGEAIYGTTAVTPHLESVLFGHVTQRRNDLYLILRFYPPHGELVVPGLATTIEQATLLTTGQTLKVERGERGWVLHGLPIQPPCELFPVIKLSLAGPPTHHRWFEPGQWCGDPMRYAEWARERGTTVWRDGQPRH